MVGVSLRALAIVAVSALVGFGFDWVRPGGVKLEKKDDVAICEAGESDLVVEIMPEDASASCAAVETVILDVRSEKEYFDGHVAGAIHLPCSADPLGDEFSGLISRAGLILVYGQSTDDARQVARALAERQYEVQILAGGYPAWEAAGLGCVSGPCECLGSHL